MAANDVPADKVVGTLFDREVTDHTLIGLGLITTVLFVIWLLRRSGRAQSPRGK